MLDTLGKVLDDPVLGDLFIPLDGEDDEDDSEDDEDDDWDDEDDEEGSVQAEPN